MLESVVNSLNENSLTTENEQKEEGTSIEEAKSSVEKLKSQFQSHINKTMSVEDTTVSITKGFIPTEADREVLGIQGLNREKSFREAKLAVQSQIEKMFEKRRLASCSPAFMKPPSLIKHAMHGVSHDDHEPPNALIHRRLQLVLQNSARQVRISSFAEETSDLNEAIESKIATPPPKTPSPNPGEISEILENSSAKTYSHASKENLHLSELQIKDNDDSNNFSSVDDQQTRSFTAIIKNEEKNLSPDSSSQKSHKMKMISPHTSPSLKATFDQIEVETGNSPVLQENKGNVYKIDYLGAVPLDVKSAGLKDLQWPLKKLYMQYLSLKQSHHGMTSASTAKLEISDTGLKVNYSREINKGLQEIFNPFSTISVWAALRFTQVDTGNSREYCFLPIVKTKVTSEIGGKSLTFEEDELTLITNRDHPPLFVCAMRKLGLQKQLECHGFVCETSEDAIVMASNLYKALLKTARNKTDNASFELYQKTPKRPPRRKNKDPYLSASNYETIRSGGSRKDRYITTKRRTLRNSYGRREKRSKGGNVNNQGDIYTKVALPRSKSFMDVSGKYDLQELFKELNEDERNLNIDELLGKIIKPDGISFDLVEPAYKALLFKLSMTLSQDEIFIRSKNIINEKKKGRNEKPRWWSKQKLGKNNSFGNVLKVTKRSLSQFGTRTTAYKNSKNDDKSSSGYHADRYSSEVSLKSMQSAKKRISKTDIGLPMLSTLKHTNHMNLPVISIDSKELKSLESLRPNSKDKDNVCEKRCCSRSSFSCAECGFSSTSESITSKRFSNKIRQQLLHKKAVKDVEHNFNESVVNCCSECSSFVCDSCDEDDKCYCSTQQIKEIGKQLHLSRTQSEGFFSSPDDHRCSPKVRDHYNRGSRVVARKPIDVSQKSVVKSAGKKADEPSNASGFSRLSSSNSSETTVSSAKNREIHRKIVKTRPCSICDHKPKTPHRPQRLQRGFSEGMHHDSCCSAMSSGSSDLWNRVDFQNEVVSKPVRNSNPSEEMEKSPKGKQSYFSENSRLVGGAKVANNSLSSGYTSTSCSSLSSAPSFKNRVALQRIQSKSFSNDNLDIGKNSLSYKDSRMLRNENSLIDIHNKMENFRSNFEGISKLNSKTSVERTKPMEYLSSSNSSEINFQNKSSVRMYSGTNMQNSLGYLP